MFFIECWSCAPFPQPFKRSAFFSLQDVVWRRTDWDDPNADICVGQAEGPVGPHFFLISVGQSISAFQFNVCWSYAPLSHIFKFFPSQAARKQRLEGHYSTTNINVDKAGRPVCPKMTHSLSVGPLMFSIGCAA